MTTDFADWLSPMLVKELRQGVRSRMFVGMFILLQVAMLFVMAVGVLTTELDGAAASSGLFWTVVGASILGILPFGGLNAVGAEIKANTLELIFLTRLTAFRIIAGKWLAIFVQSALLASAVLPYLVLRYFLGGVNITDELSTVLLMLAASAVLTAVTVGLSPYQSRFVRGALPILAVVFFEIMGSMSFGGGSPFSGMLSLSGWTLIAMLACAVILLLLMLEIGASKIAPAAENHASLKRGLAVAAFLVALGAKFLPGEGGVVTVTALILTTLVCAAAVCEPARWIPSLYRPFVARGLAGRALGRLLYPGWFTGVLFTTFIFAAFAGLLASQGMLGSTWARARLIAVFGSLIVPIALVRALPGRPMKTATFFASFQFGCAVLTILAAITDQSTKSSTQDAISFLPLCWLIESTWRDKWDGSLLAMGGTVLTALSWVALLALAAPPFRRVGAMEREAMADAPPAAGSPAIAPVENGPLA